MRATPRPGVSLRDLLLKKPAAWRRRPFRRPPPHLPANGKGKAEPLLVVEKLVKEYPRQGITKSLSKLFRGGPTPEPEVFRAVDGNQLLDRSRRERRLVGESGCGKSTTSTMVMRLIDKTDGMIKFGGDDIGAIPAKEFAILPLRKRIQMVFQDPTDSLNPRLHRGARHRRPILRLGDVHGRDAVRARCEELATQVGLPLQFLDRFRTSSPAGRRRASASRARSRCIPDLIILDEPTAALDVSVQAVVLNLLQDLKQSLGMSYLFVSHDLNVVRLLCDRVIVMKAGKIVEQGQTERVLFAPEAQYTRDLLEAIPHPPV
jgi:peptide/nickel transport system ATP-binding protein